MGYFKSGHFQEKEVPFFKKAIEMPLPPKSTGIPPEGLDFLVEGEGGKQYKAKLTPAYSVFIEGRRYGSLDPRTGEIKPSPLAQRLATSPEEMMMPELGLQEALGAITLPFTAFREALAKPAISKILSPITKPPSYRPMETPLKGFRPPEAPPLPEEKRLFKPSPEVKAFERWAEMQPGLPVGIPSWKQWGAWLALGEKPETYEQARLGIKEVAEFLPELPVWLVIGGPAKTLFQRGAKILEKQARGKTISTAEKAILERATKAEVELATRFPISKAPEVAPPVKPTAIAEEITAIPKAPVTPEVTKPLTKTEWKIKYDEIKLDAELSPEDFANKYRGQYGEEYLKKYPYALEYRQKGMKETVAKPFAEQWKGIEAKQEISAKVAPRPLGEEGITMVGKGKEVIPTKVTPPVTEVGMPKPPVIPTEAVKPPVVSEMPSIPDMIAANYEPRVAAALGQKLVKAPGIMGSINKSLLPMQAAKTDAEKSTIAWIALKNDISPSLAHIEMDAVYATNFPFKFAPPLYKKGAFPIKPIEEGLVKNVKSLKPEHKPFIQAIAEFPDRYVLNKVQRAEIDTLDGILQKQLAKEIAVGVNVRPVGLKEGQRYIPRFVREIQDLETKALTEVRQGVSTRPGIKPSSFRVRYYEEVLEGIVQGKKYTTDLRAAVEMRITAGNKAIADKMFADYLRPLGELPKERIPATIRVAREEVVTKRLALRNISSLIEQINAKAVIEWPYWLGIKRWYPKQYAELRATVKQGKTVGQKFLSWVIDEKSSLKALSMKVAPKYKLALAQARLSVLGKEGIINHAGLQGEIFPIDIASPVNALIRKEITTHQVLGQIAKVNDVARMGQTAIDTGFTLIQGLLLLANHPSRWGQAFAQCLKTLVNPKYTARWNTIPKHATTRTTIATHGGASFGGSEFTMAARAGGWLEKIPLVGRLFRRFGRVFEDYLDTARTLLLEAKLPHYTRKLGRELTDRELTDLVVTGDHMVGISSMSRLGISKYIQVLARNTMYAPRYYLAFVSILGRAFQGGIGGDMARQALVKLMVAMPAFMTALAYALGQQDRVIPTKDKPIPKMFDPRTGEFMSVEIAGVHMGIGGVWVAGFRLIGSLVRSVVDDPMSFISIDPHENPILRYGYGRTSPIISGAIDVITGQNYLGERLDTIDDYLREVVDKTFPFWLAGQITDVPKAGWQKGFAEWWGLRAWMVQYREQAIRYAEDHIKDILPEMIMPWQQEKITEGRPLTYDDLNNEQRAWLLLTFEDYKEAEEKRRVQKKDRGTDYEVADIEVRELLDAVYEADLEEIAKGVLAGQVTVPEYQDQTEYLRRIRSGQYQYRAEMQKIIDEDRWEDIEKWREENIKPEDASYDKYMELRGNPPKTFGKPDWDAWKAQVDTFLNSLDAPIRDYIERRRDDWINNLPTNAQNLERLILECETVLDAYYGQPEGTPRLKYRELNPEADAKLFLLGRITTLKTGVARNIVTTLASQYGLPIEFPAGQYKPLPGKGYFKPGHFK